MIIETLRERFQPGDDLARLAGTWSKAEADAFDAAVAPLGEIDTAPWARR